MMQRNTREEERRKKRNGAAIAAGAMAVLVLLYVGLLAVLIRGEEDFFLNGILWLYIGGGLAVIIGVFFALRQRFAEISRGEEEEAKKY